MSEDKYLAKMNQVTGDFTLLKTDPRINQVIWFGTEELPTTGMGARLREALEKAGIPYWVIQV